MWQPAVGKMFGNKSPATFLAKLFDKEEKQQEGGGGEGEGGGGEGGATFRKRSQSMFAPSVAALLAGDHVGSRGEAVSWPGHIRPSTEAAWWSDQQPRPRAVLLLSTLSTAPSYSQYPHKSI